MDETDGWTKFSKDIDSSQDQNDTINNQQLVNKSNQPQEHNASEHKNNTNGSAKPPRNRNKSLKIEIVLKHPSVVLTDQWNLSTVVHHALLWSSIDGSFKPA